MIGVTRVLRGGSVTNVLGDTKLTKEQEKELRMDIKEKHVFTLEGEA
ncbi:hypothetical protein LCGC14_1800390 [marine sediment metagenome]|uniref:Uncharacterized protein n=1 Tax=marine sediment metagenome TaxID=412755 RepID=A0A0F9HCK2_9ZZZZ